MIFLTLNFLDFFSTMIGIMSGKGYEANPFINWMGGPFSPIALFWKLAIFPLIILVPTFWLMTKFKDSKLMLILMGLASGPLGLVVINNLKVAFYMKAKYCPKCGSELSKDKKCLRCNNKNRREKI